MVDQMGRSAFDLLHELAERCSGMEENNQVNVIWHSSNCQNGAMQCGRLSDNAGVDGSFELTLDQWLALVRRPDQMECNGDTIASRQGRGCFQHT